MLHRTTKYELYVAEEFKLHSDVSCSNTSCINRQTLVTLPLQFDSDLVYYKPEMSNKFQNNLMSCCGKYEKLEEITQ